MSIIRLIDANGLREEFKARCICECDSCKYQKGAYCGLIDLAPSVISEPQKQYAVDAYVGAKPKFHKGVYGRKHDYYSCGHCGSTLKDIVDNFCWNCGYRILWKNPRCLTDKEESEQITFDDLLNEGNA